MKKVKKIHFINRIDADNVGDWNCSPYSIYYEYFKQFNILRHDIDFIDYKEIEQDDLVILGGSGLFYVTASFNCAVNRVLDLCDNVIAWSCGFNTHDKSWFNGNAQEFQPIDMSRFQMVTIRDWQHPSGLEYLPCPSVLALSPRTDRSIMRKYGVIYHRYTPDTDILGYDRISNQSSITRINDFILTSEAVITNSWHCAFWALLLQRKVIVFNAFSTKFDYYKYKPEFIELKEDDTDREVSDKLEEAFGNAKIYEGAYEEAVQMNHAFFERVKAVIEELGIEKGNDYQNCYMLSAMKTHNREIMAHAYGELDAVSQLSGKMFRTVLQLRSALLLRIMKEKTAGKKTAIKGGGLHTKKLLELMNGQIGIACIIARESLYDFGKIPVISDEDMKHKNGIEVVILSSYQYRDSMREDIRSYNKQIDVIDLYEEMELSGCRMDQEFWHL